MVVFEVEVQVQFLEFLVDNNDFPLRFCGKKIIYIKKIKIKEYCKINALILKNMLFKITIIFKIDLEKVTYLNKN